MADAESPVNFQEKTLSTVLWANHRRSNGEVESDESDKWALFKHVDKLDKLARSAGLEPFSSLLDYTDMEFNTGAEDLPAGMQSTDELMARDGVWVEAEDALTILTGLLTLIQNEMPRFGIITNDYNAVVTDLTESIEYANKASDLGCSFNFSVVM